MGIFEAGVGPDIVRIVDIVVHDIGKRNTGSSIQTEFAVGFAVQIGSVYQVLLLAVTRTVGSGAVKTHEHIPGIAGVGAVGSDITAVANIVAVVMIEQGIAYIVAGQAV